MLKRVGVIIALLLTGCIDDAPRDNPLDPNNSIKVSGKVERFYSASAIEGALITLSPPQLIALSKKDGSFTIYDDIPVGDYTLICQAEGYRTDSIRIYLPQNNPIIFKLDALPGFTNISLTTHHISRFYPPDDLFFIQLEATTTDGDGHGDINRVSYQIPDFSFSDTLTRISPQGQDYIAQLEPHQVGLFSLEQFIGKPIYLTVEDLPGAKTTSPAQFITRIIVETPLTQSPAGGVTITPPFTFQWDPVILPYPFTYTIEIYQVFFNFPLLVDAVSGIPSDSTTHTYTQALSRGNYYWVVYLVDEYGNRSRSKESHFQIP